MDTVNKKVEEVVQVLSAKDREDMENSVKKLTQEHERVYNVAVERRNVLSLALNAREVYQFGLERVHQWLDERGEKLKNLDKVKLSSAEVEKQAEKAKVRLLVDTYEILIIDIVQWGFKLSWNESQFAKK